MKKKVVFLLSSLVFFLFPVKVQAVCPVCTIAVGAGLGVSRWLGIDDSISGLWVGALIVSSGLWLANWLIKKNFDFKLKPWQTQTLSVILFYLMVIPPLGWRHILGLPGNVLWGIDKIIFGTGLGSALFLLAVAADRWLRQTNGGKVYIYYQKVILPILFLSLASFVLYLAV